MSLVPALLHVEWLALGYLAYVTVVAWVWRRPRRQRLVLTAASAADALFIIGLAAIPSRGVEVAREWLPGLQVLIGYWLSGLLFVEPMLGVERWLVRSDEWIGERLGGRRAYDRTPRAFLELVEFAYMTVSPMLPIGLGVIWIFASPRDSDQFWTVVMAAEIGCYGMLPWIQTRPPFAITSMEAVNARNIRFRRLTASVMGRVSIYVNTLPSGHAAGSFAVALAVWEQVPAAGPVFFVWSALIIIGSVLGRNHYVVDAVTGVMVAMGAWLLVRA